MDEPVEALAADGATSRSATVFARRARTGVLMIMMPSPAKTGSRDEVSFVSRPRIKNLADDGRSTKNRT
ncbi:MAG: hypothetical protein ACYDGN_04600 [Acidimicrobiales bacterium]